MKKVGLLSVVTCLVLINFTSAQMLTVNLTGTVNILFDEALDGSVTLGSTMTGSCSYDPDIAVDLDPSEWHGEYIIPSISMSIGNYDFTENPDPPNLIKFQVWKADITYLAETDDGIMVCNDTWVDSSAISITLLDLCKASASGENDYLPTSFPANAHFFSWRNQFMVGGEINGLGSFCIGGVIDSITVVPEPASIILLGLGGIILRKRRKQ